jgi:hypothetical protein
MGLLRIMVCGRNQHTLRFNPGGLRSNPIPASGTKTMAMAADVAESFGSLRSSRTMEVRVDEDKLSRGQPLFASTTLGVLRIHPRPLEGQRRFDLECRRSPSAYERCCFSRAGRFWRELSNGCPRSFPGPPRGRKGVRVCHPWIQNPPQRWIDQRITPTDRGL